MKKLFGLFLLLFLYKINVSAQTDSLKFNKYVKISIGAFNPYQTKIENFNSGKILEYYKTPGVNFSYQLEYQKQHLFFSSGINFRILPAGYQFIFRSKDLINSTSLTLDINEKISEYFYGIYSVPFLFGYQTNLNKAKKRVWVNGGIEINSIRSGELTSRYSYVDKDKNTYEIVDFISVSDTNGPKAKYFLTYHLGLGLASVFESGNQLKYGLRLNISNENLIDGSYQVNLKDRLETGTYRDTGSFYGFEVSYLFKKNKAKIK